MTQSATNWQYIEKVAVLVEVVALLIEVVAV